MVKLIISGESGIIEGRCMQIMKDKYDVHPLACGQIKILIIGASGFLGGTIYNTLKNDKSLSITGTRYASNGTGFLNFNIESDDITNVINDFTSKDKYAVICAGLSNIRFIEENRDIAYNINITKTKKLIDGLISMDYKIIFISSAAVYEAIRDFQTEESALKPSTFYGETKLIIEEYIHKKANKHLILRPAKVIHFKDHKNNMLTDWRKSALNGEDFKCIAEYSFSVVDAMDIANIIGFLIKNRISGTFNISSGEKLYRNEAVKLFIKKLEISSKVVTERIEHFNLPKNFPIKNSISNDKIKRITGFNFLKYEDILDKYSILSANRKEE